VLCNRDSGSTKRKYLEAFRSSAKLVVLHGLHGPRSRHGRALAEREWRKWDWWVLRWCWYILVALVDGTWPFSRCLNHQLPIQRCGSAAATDACHGEYSAGHISSWLFSTFSFLLLVLFQPRAGGYNKRRPSKLSNDVSHSSGAFPVVNKKVCMLGFAW
jgi:hypothetical protein